MAKGFVWTTGDIGVEKYVGYWLEHIGTVGQVRRKDWNAYFDRLIKLHIASESDRESFDRNFPQTQTKLRNAAAGAKCRAFLVVRVGSRARPRSSIRARGALLDQHGPRALGEPALEDRSTATV